MPSRTIRSISPKRILAAEVAGVGRTESSILPDYFPSRARRFLESRISAWSPWRAAWKYAPERLAVEAGAVGGSSSFAAIAWIRAAIAARGDGIDLDIEGADLDRAEPWMGPDVPPDVGVVVDSGCGDQLVGDVAEVFVVAELARHLEAGVAAHDLRAGAGVAGVDPFLEGRVRAQRLQGRQVEAEGVCDPHRDLRVGDADVNVKAAGRRPQQTPESP